MAATLCSSERYCSLKRSLYLYALLISPHVCDPSIKSFTDTDVRLHSVLRQKSRHLVGKILEVLWNPSVL